jgi:hypothetical protein
LLVDKFCYTKSEEIRDSLFLSKIKEVINFDTNHDVLFKLFCFHNHLMNKLSKYIVRFTLLSLPTISNYYHLHTWITTTEMGVKEWIWSS